MAPYSYLCFGDDTSLRDDFLGEKKRKVKTLKNARRVFSYRLPQPRRVIANIFIFPVARFGTLKQIPI